MLRPLEKNKINRSFYLKVSFLTLLIVASFYGNYYFHARKKENPEVLSKAEENKRVDFSVDKVIDQGKKTVDDLRQKGETVAGQVLGVVENETAKFASQSAKNFSDFVFDSTVGNLLKQIDKLPKEQREKIKEEMCK